MENKKHIYSAYGLSISSEMKIPELKKQKEEKKEQVKIEYGEVNKSKNKNKKHPSLERTEDGFLCYMKDFGGIKVKNKKKIVVSPESGSEENGFRFLVSGIALGLLLHLRGFITLHASAVAIQGRAIAFIGQTGMGKSTTAAALHARGHPIITDDLLVLNTMEDSVRAYPGFPHLKLTPESIAKSVNEDPDHVPKIDPDGPKRSFAAEKNFLRDPLPLQSIYALDYQEEKLNTASSSPYSEAIGGKEAIIELVRNSYVARLFPKEAVSERHLRCSSELAQTVPVYRLYREKSLSTLSTLAAFIEQEQSSNGRPVEDVPTGSRTHDRCDEEPL